jgi:outer membrane protein assembly factor BamB
MEAHGDAFVQVRDAAGAPLWSDVYAGTRGLRDTALDVAVDAAGFIHVLVQEQVLAVFGEAYASVDARLVVLRYAPDGARVWRWERAREPVEPGGYYDPGGRLGIDGDTIRLLEQVFNEPSVAIALDAAGNLLAEATLAEPNNLTVEQRAFGPDGAVYLAGNLDDSQGGHPMWVGRFAVADGSLVWSDTFGSPKQDNVTTLTPGRDGEVYLAHTASTESIPPDAEYYLRRHDSDGALAWSTLLPVSGAGTPSIPGGALHCDGSPLLAGGIARPPGPDLGWDNRLDIWVARYQTDGTPRWTFELELGPPFSHGAAGRIVGTAQGDVLIVGSHLGDDGSTDVQWLRRLTGG